MKLNHMFIFTVISLIVLLGIFFGVVYTNSESRNLVLAFSALVGTILMFILNMAFDLKDSKKEYALESQLSIYYERPEVAQHYYPRSSSNRLLIDITASKWLAKNNAKLFEEKPLKVINDLTIYSLIGYFLSKEFDWKKNSKTFVHSRQSTFRTNPKQKGADTFISKEEIIKSLQDNNNIFASVEYSTIGEGLFLPPDSKFILKDDTLTIDNAFCEITLQLEDSGAIWYGEPGSNVAHAELLPNGKHKYETRYLNINIDVLYKAQRAKNKELYLYKGWVNRLVNNLGDWFEIKSTK